VRAQFEDPVSAAQSRHEKRRPLEVSLYPSGTAEFTDTVTLHGGRSYALWDFLEDQRWCCSP
jgi:hypothetical protein